MSRTTVSASSADRFVDDGRDRLVPQGAGLLPRAFDHGVEFGIGQHLERAVDLCKARARAQQKSSGPGTPWVPKAILEVLHFNGDGTLSTPAGTIPNPFGDTGNILQPPSGADGSYSINNDCSGTVQFFDAGNVTFKIVVAPARGDTIWMIQTNPANNVFQGSATRLW